MRKGYAVLLVGILLMMFNSKAYSQHRLVTDAQKTQLSALGAKLHSLFNDRHQKALSLAKSRGWLISEKRKGGGVIYLQGLNNLGFPVYSKTFENIISAATTQTNTVQPGGSTGLNLSGSSDFLKNKLAIWDGGLVYKDHQEFAGKTITYKSSAQVIDHATHVAGTMIAKGVYAPAKGMAFNASTLQSYFFLDDITSMSAAAPNLLLSNHSYGDVSGWDLNNNGDWVWYGLPGDTTDYAFGIYNDHAQAYDQIAYSAPYYLIVESAGNARGYNGPPIGGIYYGYKSRTNDSLVVKIRGVGDGRNISNQTGYDGITTTGNAKNSLTVGAVGPLPYGPSSGKDVKITSFSSYGPTDDGRIKPDIVGMGLNVLSTGSDGPQSYLTESGTSMSAPNVTGSLYLLQEYYAQKHSGAFMRSATLKALACGTAVDAGNPGPDYIFGWGLLNMNKASQALTDNGTKSIVKESTLTQGQSETTKVTASGNGPVIATIAWTDPAGTPTDDGVVNDRSIKLVNDLDIRVSDGTNTFNPWVLDPAQPSAPATTGDNIRDNIEQVYIANSVPGRTYTITVSHKGTLQSGSQAYSMVVTGIGGTSYCTSGPLSDADSRIDNVSISNINNTPPPGCTTYSDYTNQTARLERGKTYPLNVTVGTCGATFNKIAKVYIDWNGDGSFDGPGEHVGTFLAGGGKDTTLVTVPLTVTPNNYSLMRVVLVETSDTTAVKPCGSYAKGETQDYRVQFLQTSADVGAIAVVSPAAQDNCAGQLPITVTLKNFGTKPISIIPVTVNIKNSSGTTNTYNDVYTGTLQPLAEDNLTLDSTFTATAGANYTITAATSLPNDAVSTNNQVTATASIDNAPAMSNTSVNFCDATAQYLLTGTGDGEMFWYADSTANIPLAFGTNTSASQQPVNGAFYAGLNDFSAHVGPVNKNVFGFGGYNQYGVAVTVHTGVPVIIKTAHLYVGNSGKITITVSNSNGETISTNEVNVVATCHKPGPGPQSDDPNDRGKVYNLNLALPAAGDYQLNVTFDNTATLYRSNGEVSGYPFSAGNVFSITGNTVSLPPDTSYKQFYYYFYDMVVQSMGCSAGKRQVVNISRPQISKKDNATLISNFTTGNQWYFNGTTITGATSQTYKPTQSGKYSLTVTYESGCSDTSASYNFVAPPAKANPVTNDVNLSEYPLPAKDVLHITFNAPSAGNSSLSLVNNSGKVVYSKTQAVNSGPANISINVENQPPGIYLLKLVLGQKIYSHKIIIDK